MEGSHGPEVARVRGQVVHGGEHGIEKDDEEKGPENEKEECKPFHRNHFGSMN